MPHFTLKQLKYFVAVVEAESIAEASRQLHIAQPSISIAVKTLEDMFEQQFFIRHHAQGVSMTPSGQRFYEKAKELLQTTNMRVYEVALFVGFEDAAYFSRFFKRYTGVSPKKFEYRGGNL